MLRVLKYGTGHDVPKDSKYLTTVVEEVENNAGEKVRLVWHYFLVEEVEADTEK